MKIYGSVSIESCFETKELKASKLYIYNSSNNNNNVKINRGQIDNAETGMRWQL